MKGLLWAGINIAKIHIIPSCLCVPRLYAWLSRVIVFGKGISFFFKNVKRYNHPSTESSLKMVENLIGNAKHLILAKSKLKSAQQMFGKCACVIILHYFMLKYYCI